MTQQIPLKHGDILHSGFTGPIQELLSGAAVNFRIVAINTTTLKIEAGEGDKQQGIAIGGEYRFRSTETTATLPGSLANGEHPVFVTASANNFSGPIEEPDITVHTFGLEIKKAGETPSTALYREVGKVIVEAEKIVGFRQTVNSVAGQQIEDGAFSNTSQITWTRSASGALIATITELPASSLDDETQERLFVTGDLKPTMLSTAPVGWLLCDGSEKSRTAYAALWNVLKATGKNNGNGSTTFTLPDGRGANLVGADPSGVRMKTLKPALGASGGEELHKLVIAEIPFHGHAVNDPGHGHFIDIANFNEWVSHGNVSSTVPVANGLTTHTAFTGITIAGNGGGAGQSTEPTHNNMAPYLAGNWLIKT